MCAQTHSHRPMTSMLGRGAFNSSKSARERDMDDIGTRSFAVQMFYTKCHSTEQTRLVQHLHAVRATSDFEASLIGSQSTWPNTSAHQSEPLAPDDVRTAPDDFQ